MGWTTVETGIRRDHNQWLEIAFTDQHGKRVPERVKSRDLRDARRLRRQRLAEVKAGTYRPGTAAGDHRTFAEYANDWLDARTNLTARDDRSRVNRYVLPRLGKMTMAALDGNAGAMVDLLDWLALARTPSGTPLAQNTIRSIYAICSTMFADAEQRDLISRSPCAGVRKAQRPKKAKRAQVHRGYFTAEAVERLISDERIPPDRRLLWALQCFGGFRASEAYGLRWSDYDPNRKPLGHIYLAQHWHDRDRCYAPLKGKPRDPGQPRDVPIHPTLAAMLAEWRLSGWASAFGRVPSNDDLIVPSERGTPRTLRTGLKQLQMDCRRIGVAPTGRRRGDTSKPKQHECRDTFATLTQSEGAPEVWVTRITHNASGNVLAGYTINDWPAMCRAVLCMKVERRTMAKVIRLPVAANGDGSNEPSQGAPQGAACRKTEKPTHCMGLAGGVDGTRTRGLRRDRPAL